MEMGNRGIGIYWSIVEMLYEEGGRIELSKIKAVAFAINEEIKAVQQVVQQFSLFEYDEKYFWSKTVVARLRNIKKIREAKIKAGRESGKQRLQKTAKKPINQDNNNANTCSTDAEHVLNTCSTDVEHSVQTKSNNIKEKRKGNINKIDNRLSLSSFEDETEEKKRRISRKYIEIWNKAVQGTVIPMLRSLAGHRYDVFNARLKQYGENAIIDAINQISNSEFLKGNVSSNGWHATFDWFILPSNFAKVLEGNYSNKNIIKTNKNDGNALTNTEKQFQSGKTAFDRIMSGIEARCNEKSKDNNGDLFCEETDFDMPG